MAAKVFIVDPHPFFCETLADALAASPEVEVVGWSVDEREAESAVERDAPDVVLTEVALAGGSGLSLARKVRNRTHVVVLTRAEEGDVILDAVTAGAVGCLGHRLAPAEVARSCAEAARGRFAVDHERLHDTLRRVAAAREPRPHGAPRLDTLSAREREVLDLLARGLDNDDIAGRLYLSAHTVRTHIGRILKKLGVHSRAEAVRIAMRERRAGRDVHVLRLQGPDLGAP